MTTKTCRFPDWCTTDLCAPNNSRERIHTGVLKAVTDAINTDRMLGVEISQWEGPAGELDAAQVILTYTTVGDWADSYQVVLTPVEARKYGEVFSAITTKRGLLECKAGVVVDLSLESGGCVVLERLPQRTNHDRMDWNVFRIKLVDVVSETPVWMRFDGDAIAVLGRHLTDAANTAEGVPDVGYQGFSGCEFDWCWGRLCADVDDDGSRLHLSYMAAVSSLVYEDDKSYAALVGVSNADGSTTFSIKIACRTGGMRDAVDLSFAEARKLHAALLAAAKAHGHSQYFFKVANGDGRVTVETLPERRYWNRGYSDGGTVEVGVRSRLGGRPVRVVLPSTEAFWLAAHIARHMKDAEAAR